MIRFLAPVALLVSAALLTGCASVGPSTVASQLGAAKAFVVAESGFDAAVQTADLAIKSRRLTKPAVAEIRSVADIGETYIVAGRAAVSAADFTTLADETKAVSALIGRLAALSKG